METQRLNNLPKVTKFCCHKVVLILSQFLISIPTAKWPQSSFTKHTVTSSYMTSQDPPLQPTLEKLSSKNRVVIMQLFSLKTFLVRINAQDPKKHKKKPSMTPCCLQNKG
jgi:hypothetical protein